MTKTLNKLYTGFSKTKAVLVAAVALAYLCMVVFCGGSVWDFLRLGLAIAFYIALPGVFLVRLVRLAGRHAAGLPPGYGPLLAILLGAGFFAAVYCVAMRLGVLWLLHGLPPLVGLAGVAWGLWDLRRQPAKTRRLPAARPQPHHWMLVLLFAALWLLYTFYGPAKNALPSAVGDMLLNQDLLWNVGNAESFKLAFPPQDIRFVDVRLHYHYLTELLAGALSLVSGVSCYGILAFYLQPFVLAAMVLCLYRFALLVFKDNRFKALLFCFALFLFSCASLWKILPDGRSVFWNANIIHMVTNVNSQSTAVIFLCIFTGLFVHASRLRYRCGFVGHAVLLAAFFMLCFSKGPLAALVAIAAVCALVFGLFTRQTGWRGLALGAGIGLLFWAVFTVFFQSGTSDSMMFSTYATLEKGYFGNILRHLSQVNLPLARAVTPAFWLLQSFLMMPAAFPLYLRGVFADVRRIHKLPNERLLFNAVAVGGLAAYFLFDHPALSQAYFLYAAVFFITLLAVDGTDRLKAWWRAARGLPGTEAPKTGGDASKTAARKPRAPRKWPSRIALAFVAVCAAVSLATTGFLYVHMLGSGLRQVLRNVGLEPKHPYELVMTADDQAGMEWLAQNSPKDIMFATNRIHTGWRLEGISNLYSAWCGRQAFMEGFQYAKTNMGVSAEEITRRLDINNALFSAETPPADIPRLCRENGISYLVYTTQMGGVLGSDAQMGEMQLVWDSAKLRIYTLPGA